MSCRTRCKKRQACFEDCPECREDTGACREDCEIVESRPVKPVVKKDT